MKADGRLVARDEQEHMASDRFCWRKAVDCSKKPSASRILRVGGRLIDNVHRRDFKNARVSFEVTRVVVVGGKSA